MILPGAHLVGRDEELRSIDQSLTELDQDRATVLELVGEPGIGKTRRGMRTQRAGASSAGTQRSPIRSPGSYGN